MKIWSYSFIHLPSHTRHSSSTLTEMPQSAFLAHLNHWNNSTDYKYWSEDPALFPEIRKWPNTKPR